MMAMTLCWLDLEKINITSEVTDEGPITFKPPSSDRTQATDDSDIDGPQSHPHQPWHAHGDQVSCSCQHKLLVTTSVTMFWPLFSRSTVFSGCSSSNVLSLSL